MMKPRYSFIKEETMSRIEKLLKAIINNTTYDEPRLSRIEEIFYSILNSLPYNANAQSRIEALLLALKESGLYDKRTLSRIEEILKCKLDGRTYTGWIGSRVEMLLNEWELSEIIEATFTSFPIIIKANGEPLIDYTIYGNMSQSGTPTPDNPIQPQETGERTGNLARYWKAAYVTAAGLVNANHVNGVSFPVKLEAGQTVTFTNQKTNFGRGIAIFSGFDGETLTGMIYRSTNNTVTYTADSDCYVVIWGNHDNTTSMDETVFKLCGQMLNTGSTSLPYEPYGYKIPISSADTTTPVYLGEVETTRKIGKIDLSELSWTLIPVGTGLWGTTDIPNIKYTSVNTELGDGISEKYTIHTGSGMSTALNCIAINVSQVSVNTGSTSEKPTGMFWYVLATPETAVVNEPIRKIGDYADTVSMEQAGVEIPTLNKPNNTVIDVETELKPSKMYVKYNGEGTRVYITADSKLYITSNNEIYILKR